MGSPTAINSRSGSVGAVPSHLGKCSNVLAVSGKGMDSMSVSWQRILTVSRRSCSSQRIQSGYIVRRELALKKARLAFTEMHPNLKIYGDKQKGELRYMWKPLLKGEPTAGDEEPTITYAAGNLQAVGGDVRALRAKMGAAFANATVAAEWSLSQATFQVPARSSPARRGNYLWSPGMPGHSSTVSPPSGTSRLEPVSYTHLRAHETGAYL
eukprot:7139558-Pyramimonas_sp.AAC.1